MPSRYLSQSLITVDMRLMSSPLLCKAAVSRAWTMQGAPVPGTAALPPEVPVIPVADGKREYPNGEPGPLEFRAGARGSPHQ